MSAQNKVTVDLKVEGLEEAQKKVELLIETIEKARTLVSELAIELEDNVYFNIENTSTNRTGD